MIKNGGTPHQTAMAKKVFKMKTDAPNEESLIEFANDLSLELLGEELDSLDLGDAFGAFIRILETDPDQTGELLLVSPQGFTVSMTEDWELFQWGIELPPGTFDHITRNDILDALRDESPE